MKKNRNYFFVMVVLVLALGLVITGCEKSDASGNKNSLSGEWEGTIQGKNSVVIIADYAGVPSPYGLGGWLNYISDLDHTDTGTFATIDGITSNLYSNNLRGNIVGTAAVVDSNTMTVTLNRNSIAPGTYTFTRKK